MWVLQLGGGLLGFATFPNPGSSGLSGLNPPYGSNTTDGLVMRNNAFGSIGTAVTASPYHLGRTAVHELGHWLGLRHIWGDATCGTDYCADTPPAQGANYGCPTHPFNSGGCTGNTTGEMTMNYMDYTNDACMYMFTNDQKNRAQLIMTNSTMRLGLLTSTVCNLPTVTNEVGILYVKNPTYSMVINCNNFITPTVVISNFGSNTITSATFSYNVDGAGTQTVAWTGTMLPGASSTVGLPGVSNIGNGQHIYNVGIYSPNGSTDPYTTNNTNYQHFSIIGSFTIAAGGPSVACTGNSITLTTGGGATNYTWYPGGITGTSAVVSPTVNTIYTITAKSGTCVNTRTVSVTSLASPTLAVNSPTHCVGTSTVLTASGACTYTWMNSAGTGSSISVNPSVTTQYTVIGAACNGCVRSATTSVVTVPVPSVALTVSPSGSLCPGGTATLTASGASGYNWSTGASSSVITVTPTSTTVYSVTGLSGSCSSVTSAIVPVGNNALNITITPNPATVCAGAQLVLTASGASTYTWTGGSNAATIVVSPATTSVYAVSGTNSFCTANKTVTVQTVPVPTISVSASSLSVCAGSSVTLNASGAGNYTWSSGGNAPAITVSPTVPTTYTVIGDQNGCTSSGSLAIGISGSTLNMVISVPGTVCAGGNLTLNAGGLTSYTWTGFAPGAQVTVPTASFNTYTLNGMNGSCPVYTTAQVAVAPSPPFSVAASQYTICKGQSVMLTATGPYGTYQWQPATATGSNLIASPIVTTVYSVTASSGNGCIRTNTLLLTVNPQPKPHLTTANTPCNEPCSGSVNATVTGGGGPYTFGLTGTSCVTLPCTGLCPGLYSLITMDSLGCSSLSYFSIECFIKTGVYERSVSALNIYPNPAQTQLTVEIGASFSFQLFNELGQRLRSKTGCSGTEVIALDGLPSGVYIIDISHGGGRSYRKFVKE